MAIHESTGTGTHTSAESRHPSLGAGPVNVDVARLRRAVQDEYAEVATEPIPDRAWRVSDG